MEKKKIQNTIVPNFYQMLNAGYVWYWESIEETKKKN